MALKEEKQEEIHVLMVTAPSQGHINPMLRLGKRLVDKGVHVSLATTLFGGHRMLKASIITSISGPNVIAGIPILFFSDGVSLDYDRSGNLDYFMETLAKTGPVNLSKLIKDYYHDAENPDISVELPGLPLLRAQDLPSFVLPSNPFGCFPKMMSDIFQNMEKYKWVLANSFLELEKEAIESMAEICPIRPVGPLVPPSLLGEDDQNHVVDAGISMWKADETSLEWLNNQAPSPDGGIVEEELEKCIREVLSGPKSEDFKKNVVRLKQAARAAVASGGSSDRNIQLFVDEISGNSS
ncbi:UDP-glucuronosyl/UDP-glucosyltransferase [Corchorus olitorius]|uniref:UDP-glucuronosyl/UDP-glucosyltransferase n=1 Tax=Corchorus olitorius TaxID=93759 RepID=A0A1R3GYU7_9ROSI|nr:UDP-glucuronosyl/UDP-glucosyltransferase [Corchorus olitorius]